MLIAVDARFISAPEVPVYKAFTRNVFVYLANKNVKDSFIFFVDRSIDLDLPANVTTIVISPKPKNYFSLKWWYNVRLPLAIRKYKPDIFVGTYGLCSANIKVPQLLIIHDLGFLHKNFYQQSHILFYKKNTAVSLKKASVIATVSNAVKDEVKSTYNFFEKEIIVCGGAESIEYMPLSGNIKNDIKSQYSGDCEYFIFELNSNTTSQFLNVLKAFSVFKKWQRSNMKLVIVDDSLQALISEEKLATYKFRNDVELLKNISPEEIILLISASYALIYPVLYEGFSVSLLQAMKAGVPVIAYNIPVVNEMAGDTMLYASSENEQGIAQQMKLIFKDENLRNKMIADGLKKSANYSWDKTAEIIWELILKTNKSHKV